VMLCTISFLFLIVTFFVILFAHASQGCPIHLSCSSCASLPSWKPDNLCPSPPAEETCILETIPLIQMPLARFSHV
jgi:hypothetical protein